MAVVGVLDREWELLAGGGADFCGVGGECFGDTQRLEADNDECGMMNNELGQNLEALLCGDVGAICADPV